MVYVFCTRLHVRGTGVASTASNGVSKLWALDALNWWTAMTHEWGNTSGSVFVLILVIYVGNKAQIVSTVI